MTMDKLKTFTCCTQLKCNTYPKIKHCYQVPLSVQMIRIFEADITQEKDRQLINRETIGILQKIMQRKLFRKHLETLEDKKKRESGFKHNDTFKK